MQTKQPTIKGLFVNSHINAVRRKKGAAGMRALALAYKQPLVFGNFENIPIAEELKIIHCCLEICADHPISPERFEYEAGRFHFYNFVTTPFARTVLKRFGKNFSLIITWANRIAGRIFKGVTITSQQVGVYNATIIMEHAGYPLEHFQGFFEAWIEHVGLIGIVRCKKNASESYEYALTWKEPITTRMP